MATQAPLGKMIVELGLDTTDFGKGLQSSKRELRTWSNEMSASMRAAEFAGDKVGKAQARFDGLTKIIQAQEKQVESLRKSYDNSFVDGEATAQTEKLAAQLKQAEANLITYNKELRTAAGELAKVKVQTEGLTGTLRTGGERLQKFGKHATTIGTSLTKNLTVPLAAGVTLATKAAMDWESSFAGVIKTSDELVDTNGNVIYSYEMLEDELRSLTKQLPATHTEIAAVGEAAGQLGIQTDNITSFTKTMIDLGESTNMSAETAAESLARLANITGMSQDDFDRLGSSIVDLGNNFATTEADIVALAMRLAGAGSQVGMSEADIMGLAAALSSVGIEAEMGGSALSKTLINMSVASETGLNAMKDLEYATGMSRRELELLANHDGESFKGIAISLGMTTTELNKILKAGKDLEGFAAIAGMTGGEFKQAFERDAVGALGAFIEGLGSAEEKGTTAIALLDELGISEVRLRDSLLRAGNASELFAESVQMSNEAWDENTALAVEAQQRYDTLESQLGMLRNEAVDVAISFGGPFVKALKEALEIARPFIGSIADLAESFADADEETQKSIIKLVTFGIAAGPVIGTVGKLSTNIGGATVKTIDFLGEMAKKKAVEDFGKTVATAGGTKGVGLMTTSLATLNPWLIGLVGVGGLLAVGYGAWKLWGEEAYKAGERTKRWGVDVGEATDEVLTDIQDLNQNATGQIGLMSQGISVGTAQMGEDFSELGLTIENSLVERITKIDSLMANLPETVRGALTELLEEDKKKMEESLQIVQENNERIAEIRKQATDNNREISLSESKLLQDLNRESMEAYVNTLKISQGERQQILDAMNGDVESATKDQALIWAQSLAEQRSEMKKHHNEQRNTYLEALRDEGYSEAAIAEHAKIWDDANSAMTLGLEQQLAIIADKYPEIMDEILFSNGQMVDGLEVGSEHIRAANEEIIAGAVNMSSTLESTAIRNVGKMKWLADETTNAGRTWNNIILDEKTGEVKTNVREAVIEASEDAVTWNHIRFQLKNADLDSNAKLIIGEAAIMHGRWDGMAWEDKQAVLKDNFSETVYKAIVDEGTWDKLKWEEKVALLNNEFSDGVIQAIMDEGKWADLPWEQKHAILTTNSPETLKQALKDLGVWETLPISVKKLLADKTHLDKTVENAQKKLNSLKDKEVTLTTRNQTIYESIYRASGNKASSDWVRTGGSISHNEKGTNYHPGGPAIVNDQKGSTFRELVVEADGTSYIPHGRNVLIPNLSRGAKVLRASLTKQRFPDIPQYQRGIGNIPVESTVVRNINNTQSLISQSTSSTVNNNSNLESLLKNIINLLNKPITPQLIEIPVVLNGNEVARLIRDPVDKELGYKSRDKNIAKGRG